MRKTLIAGNWKMNKDLGESSELINALASQVKQIPLNVEVVLCPPFPSLLLANSYLKATPIKLGAQNMSHHDDGAFTGEVSWRMLKSVGCEYVIVGHSERRQYYGETDELINLKAKKAVFGGLKPIICVGETLEEREKGVTEKVVAAQVQGVLRDLGPAEMAGVVIAYEPVWAIGTGRNATPAQAEEVHKLIRTILAQLIKREVSETTPIIYGGSVKPDNASDLLVQDDIDGALVGGACLRPESFMGIILAGRKK